MITLNDFSEKADNFNYLLRYQAVCLTCNDPGNTVMDLITTEDKTTALTVAQAHEEIEGVAHQINISYFITDSLDNEYTGFSDFVLVKKFY